MNVQKKSLTISFADEIGDYDGEVATGMIFRNRDAFRQYMAVHAINKKFRFRSIKSEPGLMVLECCGESCP